MSFKAIKAVYRLEISLTPPQSAVLQALAWRTESDGIITYPTTGNDLAKLVHFPRSTCNKAIHELRKLGLKSKPRSGRANVFDLSFIYQLPPAMAPIEQSPTTPKGQQMAPIEHEMAPRGTSDVSKSGSKGTEGDKEDKEDKVEPLRGPSSSSTSSNEPREVRARRAIEAARDKLPGNSAEHGMMNTLLKRLDDVPADPKEREQFFDKLLEEFKYWGASLKD